MTGELRRKHDNPMPADRSFGRLFAGIALAFAAYLGVTGKSQPAIALAIVAAALLAVAQFKPTWLHLPNLLWYKLGNLLSAIVNPIVLGVIFYLLLTPLALLLRLFGRDALRLKFPGGEQSYWIERGEQAAPAESFKQQF